MQNFNYKTFFIRHTKKGYRYTWSLSVKAMFESLKKNLEIK